MNIGRISAVVVAALIWVTGCGVGVEQAEVSTPELTDGAGSHANSEAVDGTTRPGSENSEALETVDYFAKLEPGAELPSGETCAQQVRPIAETVLENEPYNNRTGESVVGKTYLSIDIDADEFEARVGGDFTGTTDEIIQWGACKWGFDENTVRAQAYAESSWFAGKLGDCGESTQPQTGGEGGCSSVGLLQIRAAAAQDPVFPGVWPVAWESTAFNVDYALAVRRACFEGLEPWLNDQPARGADYAAGDEWGCMGRWFSGNWYDPAAVNYIETVRGHLEVEPWGEFAGCPNWLDSFYCSDLDREVIEG